MGPAYEATEESPDKNAAEEADEGGQQDIGDQQPDAMPNSMTGDAAEAVDGATEDQERYNSIDSRICGSLEDRLHAFEGLAMQSAAVPEDVVSARIQCLSICKVLVTIHKKSVFLLVIAYAQLGDAYL